jgi:hypothetical protein
MKVNAVRIVHVKRHRGGEASHGEVRSLKEM